LSELPSPCKVIATTDERFRSFAPYVASVNDAGKVAFQAALQDGGSGVYAGAGGDVVELVGSGLLAGVTSHPDVNRAGATSFYADLRGSGQGVCLLRDGTLETIADTRGRFVSIGPLGPTMNEAGSVAFRGKRPPAIDGVFVGDDAGVRTVADTRDGYRQFDGLPVVDERGSVVFRADREDGVQGIYACRGRDIQTVAETGDTFETLSLFPSTNDRGTVAFAATVGGQGAAIVTADEGRITVAETEGAFESFRGALIDGRGAVVFLGTPRRGNLGLFTGPDPDADRILGIGDDLLGSTVTDFAANPVSINAGGQLAVRVSLADGREVILRVDPPD
jgi:hypothetical protein